MQVPTRQFYEEVVGHANFSSATAVAAFTRWGIPLQSLGRGNGKRKYFSVDIVHLDAAKAAWAREKSNGEHKSRARGLPVSEQKLDEIITRLRGIEVALNALMKLAKS